MIFFLIKKVHVAFKLRIYLDFLFRPPTSHQTKASSEASNVTPLNLTLKLDISSLQMNVKQVLCEHSVKIMTWNHFKGELSILGVSHDFVFVYWKQYLFPKWIMSNVLGRYSFVSCYQEVERVLNWVLDKYFSN